MVHGNVNVRNRNVGFGFLWDRTIRQYTAEHEKYQYQDNGTVAVKRGLDKSVHVAFARGLLTGQNRSAVPISTEPMTLSLGASSVADVLSVSFCIPGSF